jgi:ribonuclease R
MTTLSDDFYRMHPDGNALVGRRNGRVYAVGASLQVIVDKVDRFKRQVDFRVFEEAYKPTRGPERRKGGR